MKIKLMIVSLVLVSIALAALASTAMARDVQQNATPDTPVVARVFYRDRADLDRLAGFLDVWEVKHSAGYLTALLPPAQYEALAQAGYRLEIDPVRTAALTEPRQPLPGQGPDSIPGYPCYRTVEETYAAMQAIATAHPTMATWIDIGDSWDMVTPGGNPGYNIYALKLTNSAISGPKPTFFLMAEIHAREYVTAEAAARFAEYVINNYGIDPDITWLMDYYQVYIVTMTNPDGRKLAEAGQLWRKNVDNNDGCSDPSSWGTDLNRNYTFKWNMGGSSGFPCDETYHGPTAGSEPETTTIQNFVATLFPDQRGPGDTDPAPANATGSLLTLHSAAGLVLWPWGWSYNPAPNSTQLQTLGRKMAFFNGYTPQQSIDLYITSGTTDDWSYGNLGIASYTIEMGTDFFQDCGSFESTIYPDNLNAIMEIYKSARLPYMEPSGPDALNVAAVPGGVTPGEPVAINATIDDTRFNNSNGVEPTQNISATEYYIDTPPWIENPAPVRHPMTAADGTFDENVEAAVGTIDTTGLSVGRHMIFVRGEDAAGNWGVVSAAFLYIMEPGVSPAIEGFVRDASNNQPLAATVKAGAFQASTDPTTGFYSMVVISGTYDVIAEATNHAPVTAADVNAQNYQTVQQDFYLSPICTVFSDNVENGNQGWTAQSPWAITTENSNSPTHSWTDSPGGNYQNYRNISLTSQSFDLSEYTGLTLNFWHIYDTEPGWDFGYVEYSTNGSSWTTVATYDGYGHTTWEQQTLDLSGLNGQANGRIRFRFTSDSNTVADGWHIDDISLQGGGPACTSPLAPTAEFTSSASIVTPGEPIQFTDLTIGTPPFTYQWDFGDGLGTSNLANPTYAYLSVGYYTVTLTVTNSLGSDSASHPILVQEGQCEPIETVSLNLLNTEPLRPGDVAHISASFTPPFFTRPFTYTIEVNDGTPPVDGVSSSAPFLFDHTFTELGNYSVMVSAWNCPAMVPVTGSLPVSVITYTAGLEVSPLAQSGSGDPGTPVTYTFTLTNTGEQPDTYAVTHVGGTWQVNVPASIGPLAAGASASVQAVVIVAPEAAAGAVENSLLEFASSHAGVTPITVTAATTANTVHGLDVAAEALAQEGFPGKTVTYTLQVTNTGNTTDTFDVFIANQWGVLGPATIGPLAGGESTSVVYLIEVPVSAPNSTSDIATVTVTSEDDPAFSEELVLTTTSRWNGVWVPIVMK